jgi:hypothetical protein
MMPTRFDVGHVCRLGAALVAVVKLFVGTVSATPMSPQQVLGDWEITGLLVTDGFSNSKRSMKPDDAYVMGRKYSFQTDSVTYDNETKRCKLDTSLARQTFPIKALFAEERIPRPKLIRDRFYRRAAQYALGSLAKESVTIYAYQCAKVGDKETRRNNTGNWFAATKDTIIWPLAPDALVLMKRQPSAQTAEQKSFCESATLASDKLICADREMWLMKVFTEAVHECAVRVELRTPDELRVELDAYANKRKACEGNRDCVYDALNQHVNLLAQSIPSVVDCAELMKKSRSLYRVQC